MDEAIKAFNHEIVNTVPIVDDSGPHTVDYGETAEAPSSSFIKDPYQVGPKKKINSIKELTLALNKKQNRKNSKLANKSRSKNFKTKR